MKKCPIVLAAIFSLGLFAACVRIEPAAKEVKISSKLFGQVKPDKELQEAGLFYEASADFPPHGRVEVSFLVEHIGQLESLINSAERSFEKIKRNEYEILAAAAPRIEAFYEKYFERKSIVSRKELVTGLHLTSINFHSDGAVSLWYSSQGLESFNGKDVKIELHSDLRVKGVRFDG